MSDAKTAAPPKKSNKLVILLAATVLLAGGAAAGGWFLFGPGQGAGGQEQAQLRREPLAKPLYTQLDPFTVNLQDARGERYAQVGVTLQYTQSRLDAAIKDHLPTLRNDVLLLISGKQIEELLTPDGKIRLAEEIRTIAGKSVGWEPEQAEADDERAGGRRQARRRKAAADNPIDAVLFSSFIVQ